MATELQELVLTEISLVDKGANPGAKVVVAKRAKDKSTMSKIADLWKRWTAGEKITVEKEIADPMKQLSDLVAELPQAKQDLFNALIAACMAQGSAPAPAAPAKPEPPKDAPGAPDMKPADMAKILKSASPETVEVFKALTDKVEILAKGLAAELSKNRKAEAIAKAATLKHIPGASVEKMAEVIEKLGNEAPEVAAQVVDMLAKASAALAKRLPMVGRGSAAGAGREAVDGSAESELEAAIQKRLGEVRKSASGGRYTYEQAYMDVITETPDLVKKLSEERQD